MFLVRLMYLKDSNKGDYKDKVTTKDISDNLGSEKETSINYNIVDQIKNITQKEEVEPKIKSQDTTSIIDINSFEELIDLCVKNKELKFKYELENNVNLVSFTEGRIEIAFNENLDKVFIKELSNKLFQWTNKRWIILLSKKEGLITKKQEEKISKNKILEDVKKSEIYNKILDILPDSELVEFEKNKETKDD